MRTAQPFPETRQSCAGGPAGSDFAGLRAFLADYPAAKAFFLYGGSRRRREGTVDLIPLDEALPRLPELLAGGA